MKNLEIGLIALLLVAAQTLMAAELTWLTDLEKALTQAKQEKKLVLIDFTGSDWCPACIELKKNVFEKKDFLDFAKDNLVLVLADFPHVKELPEAQVKANLELSKKYEVEMLPTIVVLDSSGKILRKETGYLGESPKDFVAKLTTLKRQS